MDQTPDSFGELVRSERLIRGLRYGALARLLDPNATPKQISRMSQRLVEVERSGRRDKRLVTQLIRVLHLDPDRASEILRDESRKELERWREWVASPVDPALHIRAIPGVWITKRLPNVSSVDALRIAADFAREKRLIVCLAVDRALSVWFDLDGREYARVRATSKYEPRVHTVVDGHQIVLETRE